MEKIEVTDIRFEAEIYKRQGVVEVHRARLHRQLNEQICVKKLYVDSTSDANDKYQECIAMLQFSHPNIVRLRSCIISGNNKDIDSVYIIMEFFPEGDLDQLIKKKLSIGGFSEDIILSYAKQLIDGLSYMQEKGTSHRDLKPQNIFVTNNGTQLKIGDLGSATKVDREVMSIIGTPLYLSPKVRQAYGRAAVTGVLEVKHNPFKSDVYSLGLVLLYMASLKNPVGLTNLTELEVNITKRLIEISNNYPKITHLLENMLKVNEDYRPDFLQLIQIFEGLDKLMLCGKCQNILKINSVHEFKNSKFCPNCYQEVINLPVFCGTCQEYRQNKDVYSYKDQTFCKICVSKIEFIGDNIYCLKCEQRIDAGLNCECIAERCYICKGLIHNGESCSTIIMNQAFNQNYTIGYSCECGVDFSKKMLDNAYYFCQTENKYFCIVCCKEWTAYNGLTHSICTFILENGHLINQ